MSSTVQILIVDDIDGSPADETVRFALDGAHYEIDLSRRNATALRQMLSRYIKSGRRVSGGEGGRSSVTPSATGTAHRNGRVTTAGRAANARSTARGVSRGTGSSRISAKSGAANKSRAIASRGPKTRSQSKAQGLQDMSQIRDWARSQGITVGDRGRIPTEIITKFQNSVR